jgi:uncharacterized protein YoxC
MAFTVSDFEDLLALLQARPDWQRELRHLLVGDDLAAINRSLESLAESVKRLEEAVAANTAWSREMFERMDRRFNDVDRQFTEVDQRFNEVDRQFTEVDRRFNEVDRQFTEVDRRFIDVDKRFNKVDANLATLNGKSLETWYRERATAVFGRVFDKVKLISPGDLRSFWRDGVISKDEWDDICRLDLLIEGRDDDGVRCRAAVEISHRADAGDLERAVRRAEIVSKTGVPCWPVVATEEVSPEMPDLVRERGAALLREGDVVYWPAAS